MNNKTNVRALTILALMTALVIIFSFTPIGSIPVGPLVITLNTIPVAIAAIALGPKGGLALGAVFGLMGAILYLVLRNRGRFAALSLRRMAVMIAFSVYLGFADGGVDNAAHLGGLFCGFVLAFLLCRGFTRR